MSDASAIEVPASFIEQVKTALSHLYDFSYLQRHSLSAEEGRLALEQPTEATGNRLRRRIMAAIESMNPGPAVPFRSPSARLYDLVRLRYVEALTVQEAAKELGLSPRQAYRDLRRAEESVAVTLWSFYRQHLSPPDTFELDSVEAEMARLEARPTPVAVDALLQYVTRVVEPLAARRHVRIYVSAPVQTVNVLCDSGLAKQLLTSLVSQAIQQMSADVLELTSVIVAPPTDAVTGGTSPLGLSARAEAMLTLLYRVDSGASSTISSVAVQLADRLQWQITEDDLPDGRRRVTVWMATYGRTMLVIDDNEGLAVLLGRYLADESCQVVAARDGRDGLQMAQSILPDVIILDVMMPGMDGWEVLQRFQANPTLAHIPVVICSVFDDPELAYSMGASCFLAKPVGRDAMLTALRHLGVI